MISVTSSYQVTVSYTHLDVYKRQGQHLERTDDHRMPKKILSAQVYKSRKKDRPWIRWLDDVLEDLRRMDVKHLREWTGGIGEDCFWKPGFTLGCNAKEKEEKKKNKNIQNTPVYFSNY